MRAKKTAADDMIRGPRVERAIDAATSVLGFDDSPSTRELRDPRELYPKPPFEKQTQPWPGLAGLMTPRPDHGEESYRGSGRLLGRKALITGGDSGIGRAAAIAFAREGADVAINYLPEEEADAREVMTLLGEAEVNATALPGDIRDESFCRKLVDDAARDLGGLDILVNNAFSSTTPRVSMRANRSSTLRPRISTGRSKPISTRCSGSRKPRFRISSRDRRSSIRVRSSPSTLRRSFWIIRRPRPPFSILPDVWRSSSPTKASGSTPWRPARSGRRSSRAADNFPITSPNLAPIRLSAAPDSRRKSPRFMFCSRQTRRVSRRARCLARRAARWGRNRLPQVCTLQFLRRGSRWLVTVASFRTRATASLAGAARRP
ncbi:MAG: hypothetical protein FD172_2915 [Methylocystaceae bacterium]|nr:MAG: hypothetical protein FD172_2915 [Methylocystaceae bacterium]